MHLISVCIPTYNRKAFLKEALQSLQRQTFQNFETIVFDDGSTDGTSEMIKDEGFSARYYWHENRGEYPVVNKLIQLAACDYIAFLHSDDLFVPDALQRMADAVNGQDEECIIYGNYLKIDKDGNPCGESKRKLYSGWITQQLFEDVIVHPVGTLFPKKALLDVGGMDENLSVCADYKMELLISLKYRFVALDKPTFMRRRHDSNISKICFVNRLAEYHVLKDFYENLGGKKIIPADIAKKRLAKEAYRAGRSAIDEGRRDQGRELLDESWQIHPTLKTFLHRLKSMIG